ncbi:MAG: ABC-F family ATP-binding cassette domain-containing protein [Prevotellaceae bacterium]|jgi:ATP-binding cassette subfamily F protein uup|nr:ABC-F family ATP-binding cassette domain-containing protein [Prevotellaceae bacterium]
MVNVLQIENLTKSYGDLLLFNNINFSIVEGQKTGLIGINGAGKTSLMDMIAGKTLPDSGNIVIHKGIRTGYLEQNPQFAGEMTVMQACFSSGSEIVQAIEKYEASAVSGNSAAFAEAGAKMDALEAWDYEYRIKQILGCLNIFDFDRKISELSGGQVKRVALANVLINEPELLVLDEPTNHLDLEMIEWLEDYLTRSRLSLIMVTHDRYFLDRICSDIIEIDNKQIYHYRGKYSYYIEKRQERIEAQNSETERASNLFRKELEWMRRQPQARATKAKSRIDAFYALEEKAKNRTDSSQMKIGLKTSHIGKKIFEARHVSKSFDNVKILNDFNYVFSRYEKMGIVGNNGAGKSTFLKLLLNETEPDSGYFDIGETVNFGYYSQSGIEFDRNMKVIDAVRNIAEVVDLGNGQKLSAMQFLGHFMFPPEKQHNYIGKLSGGERRRLYLCTVLMKNPNFLVLDEPTNDLDIITLNILENYLQNFNGCLILVSHDRYFMDKIVDHLLVFKGNAEIKDFPGNYSDYRYWKETSEKEKSAAERKETGKNSEIKRDKVRKRKLSFKEQREFETLEQEIALHEKEKYDIEQTIGNITDTGELYRQSERISELLNIIDSKTNRWIELSELAVYP